MLPRAGRGPALCPRCRGEIDRTGGRLLTGDGIDSGFAALPYAGAGRRLVAALKFARLLVVADLGAALMAARAPWSLEGRIVPVPAAPLRLAARGFDPAAELASALAGATGLEVASVLGRRDLRHQRGRRRRDRLARPPAVVTRAPAPAEVLLVDDVVTTGATVDACAAALREAGCGVVRVTALAAVPAARPRLAHRCGSGVAWTLPESLGP